jgi:fibronectin type 3 domain-containing protein
LVIGLSGCSGGGGGGGVTAPTNLLAVSSSSATEISLSWSGSLPTDGAYLVYRGTAPGGESSTPIGAATSASYTDADPTLQGSTDYYYYVTAATTSEQSAPSNEVSATTVDPGAIGVIIQ